MGRAPWYVVGLGVVCARLSVALAGCTGETFEGGEAPGTEGGALDAAPDATTDGDGTDAAGDDAGESPFVDGSDRTGLGCAARNLPPSALCLRFDDGGTASSYFLSTDPPGPTLDQATFSSAPAAASFTTGALPSPEAGGPMGGLLRPTFVRDVYVAFDLALPSRTGSYLTLAQITWNDVHGYGYTLTAVLTGPTSKAVLAEGWTGAPASPPAVPLDVTPITFESFRRVEFAIHTSDAQPKRVVVHVGGVEVGQMPLTNAIDGLDFAKAAFYVNLAADGQGRNGTFTANFDDVVVVPLP